MENNDDTHSYSSLPSLVSDSEIEERKEVENEGESKDEEDFESEEEDYEDYNSVPLLRDATLTEEIDEIDHYRRQRYFLPTPSRFPIGIITRQVFYKSISFTIVIPNFVEDVDGYTANIQSDLLAFEKSCENSRYQILESLTV